MTEVEYNGLTYEGYMNKLRNDTPPGYLDNLDIPRDEADRRQQTERILVGIREVIANIEEEAEIDKARECAANLRQAYCYVGKAIENWRKCK